MIFMSKDCDLAIVEIYFFVHFILWLQVLVTLWQKTN